MLAVLSPSKTFDFETRSRKKTQTVPELLDQFEQIVVRLVKCQRVNCPNSVFMLRRYAEKCETSLN